jgi:hypothetical protein
VRTAPSEREHYASHHQTSELAGFVVDPQSVDRNNGRQIDWANVGQQYRETPGTPPVVVVVGAAGAAGGATSVPVAALSGAIPRAPRSTSAAPSSRV